MPSSVIHGMLYWPERKMLDVVFRGARGTYRYFDVSAKEWRLFKRAPSKGTYLNASFKARHPRYERLAAIPAEFQSLSTEAGAGAGAGAGRDLLDENVWGFYENSLE